MRNEGIASTLFLFAALFVTAGPGLAQSVVPPPQLVCETAGKPIHEKEMIRVPRAATQVDETGETYYVINANESWRRTEVEVKRGQRVEVAAGGIVRWAPDGIEKIDVTPDGTRPPYRDGWNYYHFPFPEAGIGSLVMRIGRGIYPVGSARIVEAEDDGFVEFMINDDKLDDNSGFFTVKARVPAIER